MVNNKKLTFTTISKQKDLILISSMKELTNAFNKDLQIIALKEKVKVINPTNDENHHKERIPKYFREFKETVEIFIKKQEEFNLQVLKFMQDQTKFNQEQREFNQKQEKFNQYVLDVFKRNNLK